MYLLIRFFAGGPLRFLLVPCAGLLLIGGGAVAGALHGRVYAAPQIVFLVIAVALHFAVLGWYLRLLARGEARRLWAEVLDFLGKAGSARR